LCERHGDLAQGIRCEGIGAYQPVGVNMAILLFQ
jgi:hypothetical protein